MTPPRWTEALLRRVAPPARVDDVLGDLEEAHRLRVARRGRWIGHVLTAVEALDLAVWLWRERRRQQRRKPRRPARPTRSDRRRSAGWISGLDFKLGVRMLVKYPGLTVVGSLAMATAVAVGAGTFVFLSDLLNPTLPFDDGDRIVTFHYRDVSANKPVPATAYDLSTWRATLESVEQVSAYRSRRRNLITEDGRAEPVNTAEMTASGFGLVGVPPRLGRTLAMSDEAIGAPPVAVVSYDVWRHRLDGDREVVGRRVHLGAEEYTIVGVMPEGFAFPSNHHLWTPLRFRVADYEPGVGPALSMFARLAPGASLDGAQVELTTVVTGVSQSHPATHGHRRAEVRRYGSMRWTLSGVGTLGAFSLNSLFFLALLTLVSANVALLVFARTATRESELVVRTALGASRRRIVMQLFAEALVLGGVAAVVGIVGAHVGIGWAMGVFAQVEEELPFWFHRGITPVAALYAAAFTVFGAIVVGVVPALKATGRKVQAQLQRVAGHGSGLRMGGLWTGVIVTQIAFTVFFMRIVVEVALDTAEIRSADVGFAADEYLSARLAADELAATTSSQDTTRATFHASYRELARRLSDEPEVVAVTFAEQIPGAYHARGWVEVEDVPAPATTLAHRLQTGVVDLDFFDALGTPVVAGRGFRFADLDPEANVVIVNTSFVDSILGGRSAVGRRLRYLNADQMYGPPQPDQPPGPWYRIVGVVRDVAMTIDPDLRHGAGVYHPLTPTVGPPLRMAVHLAGDPLAFAPRLRSITTAVDPALRLDEIRPMDEAQWEILAAYDAWFRAIVLIGAIVMVLSNAGIYAIMSFAVSRRTREIGVRVALGANARRIVTAIFSRTLTQVTVGVAVGAALLVAVGAARPSLKGLGFFGLYLAVMMAVCLLACIVPTRRALRIQPTEALREG